MAQKSARIPSRTARTPKTVRWKDDFAARGPPSPPPPCSHESRTYADRGGGPVERPPQVEPPCFVAGQTIVPVMASVGKAKTSGHSIQKIVSQHHRMRVGSSETFSDPLPRTIYPTTPNR